jgi:alpha/beta superfamily hydrolase
LHRFVLSGKLSRFPTLMADVFHRSFFLEGPAGQLEAMLWTVPNPHPAMTAVICHPHPLYGGTLHNKVVYQAAKALHQRGMPVLRFNFRGAGLSEGAFDHGRGETEDVRAAVDYLGKKFSGKPILLAGFSFGAWVGLRVGCEDARVAELIGLGIPLDDSDFSYLRNCVKPKLFLQGELDQFAARKSVEALFKEVPEPKKLVFFAEADHFFRSKLDKVGAAIDAWIVERHGSAGPDQAP